MNPNTTHQFNVAEAVKFGIEPAILLSNIRFWLDHNKANKKNIHDGFAWTYNSATAFSELFPYMKERMISRHLKTLCDAGMLQSGCYNKMKYDRKLWYTIPAEFAVNCENVQPLQPAPLLNSEIQTPPQPAPLAICQIVSMDTHDMTDGYARFDRPIADINTDIKPDINKSVVVVTRDKVFLNFDDLNAGEKECYHWAMTQPYWSSSTSSIEHFKTIYAKPSAKGLRGQFDAHKKALTDGKGQTGHSYTLNKTNGTGSNYATNYANNKPLTATQRRANLERIINETESAGTETNIDECTVVSSYTPVVNAPLASYG